MTCQSPGLIMYQPTQASSQSLVFGEGGVGFLTLIDRYAPDVIQTLAMERGKVPQEKIIQIELPICHDTAEIHEPI